MASLNISGLDKVLAEWNKAKGEQAAAAKKIEECKTKVEGVLSKAKIMELETQNYKVTKRMQSKEFVSQKDMPADVWSKYCKKSTFAVLSFTALTGKRSAGAKAKAKAKAKPAAAAAEDEEDAAARRKNARKKEKAREAAAAREAEQAERLRQYRTEQIAAGIRPGTAVGARPKAWGVTS